MLELPFTHKPGRRERHLRRRHGNPLFSWPPEEVQPERLLAAQAADHAEMEAFREDFRKQVGRAAELQPGAGSEEVLGLKADLERLYEQSFGLPESHTQERQAIRRLIELIMQAVHRSAGADPIAQAELAEAEEARALHFQLIEQPLVADLLSPDSPITPADLTPTLLSAPLAELEMALELFDSAQIAQIAEDGARLTEDRAGHGLDMTGPLDRLALILGRLQPERGRSH